YDTTFGRARTEKKAADDDKSATSRIATKYGAYNAGYQRDSSASGSYSSSRSDSNRLKPTLEKKETNHPPVSYRALARTTPRSRDPSPDKSSSTPSYNYNKIYPTRPYTRSVSRELDTSTTIPKYTGRSSLNKDDTLSRRSSISREDLTVPTKYGGRSSITKDDVPKYGGRSSITKEDLVPKYGGRSSLTKDDLSKYRPSSRAPSREDLTTGSQKYITSRFLPKNSVEKSYTAYARPSTIRSHETIRKNRELLNVLHAQQEQEKVSRPSSRCSSIITDEIILNTPPPIEEIEMETVSTVTRSTSPSPTSSNIARSRRSEIAKIVERQISRPKHRIGIDVEVQSDRLDDSTKNSKFSGASRISATPWSSFLDMKFSSPSDKKKEEASPKSISRASSNKSLSQEKKSPPKTKPSPPKQALPPQIPKSDSSKSTSLHSINTANKDFRKSVLNMNPDGSKKKVGRRSNSASSAESETDAQPSEAADVAVKSNSVSKLPQRLSSDKTSQRSRRSPSSDASTTSSSTSEEEKKSESHLKVASSRTSIAVSSADESPKPPPSPRQKSEAEAKSFLMRALAPVTNLFNKTKSPTEPTPETSATDSKPKSDQKPGKLFKSGEKNSETRPKTLLRHVESGELAWWLDKNAEVPEGVYRLDSNDSTDPTKNIMDAEYQERHKIRHIDSGERSWWLNSSENIPEMVQAQQTKTEQPKFAIRHQESGGKGWWLQSNHSEEFDVTQAPLGDRASPEGLEMPKESEGRLSPYDNVQVSERGGKKRPTQLFISRHRNIDEILGGCGGMWSPLMDRIFEYQDGRGADDKCMEIDPGQVKIHDSTAQRGVIQPTRM
ncbi:hypothetical protein BDFB_010671, partial [Asbolus verrucosus]